jgi:hypothetical protein
MTSPLVRIESHPQSAKRLIGINYEQFLALVALAEKKHIEKLSEIEKNKIRIIAPGDGFCVHIAAKLASHTLSLLLRRRFGIDVLTFHSCSI